MKIKTTTDLKLNQTQDIDLTKLILERQEVKETLNKHGVLWFILYELFVLEPEKVSIIDFKASFLKDMFICIFLLTVIYVFRLLLGG